MASPELLRAIEALDEVPFCEGTVRLTERVAIMLPDGDLAAAEDSNFVDWLIEHGEAAPFGLRGETKVDPAVRHAIRLRARGEARVDGFDPTQVLDAIEHALSPRTHLDARLTDVIVYPPGGHFAAHKDTPTSSALVGTLVVCLPFPHRGGAFWIETDPPLYFDWGVPIAPDVLRWVAVFGDLDHAIEHVELGHRVTLVYSLFETDRPRVGRDHERRLAVVRRVASALVLPDEGPLMIACTRHVIGIDGPQPLSLGALRGADREIADVLVEAGFRVGVRTCVAAREHYDEPPATTEFARTDSEMSYARLHRPLLAHEVEALLECVVFDDNFYADGGGYMDHEVSSLQPWILDRVWVGNWLFRKHAVATYLRTVQFAGDGFVGNAASETFLYKLAALEVTRDR